jgi:hypothetical protein
MRVLIVTIDCDSCNLPFEKMAVTGDSTEWKTAASDLEQIAQQAGWHCYNGRHDCFNCLLEALYPEECHPLQ